MPPITSQSDRINVAPIAAEWLRAQLRWEHTLERLRTAQVGRAVDAAVAPAPPTRRQRVSTAA